MARRCKTCLVAHCTPPTYDLSSQATRFVTLQGSFKDVGLSGPYGKWKKWKGIIDA